jgi:D-glycero-D-manno-heptose 1,7-bisphosphate phosphatase
MRPATVRQCAVLAGGLGSRLGALTAATPKPVLDCGGRPFLAWLLRELVRFGVEECVLLTGHLAEQMRQQAERIAAELPRPLRLLCSEEPVPAGTGGALFHARALLDERFLLCNGDSLLDANLATLLAAAARDEAGVLGHLALLRLADAGRYGAAQVDAAGWLRGFAERPPAGAKSGTINAGIGVFDRGLLDFLSPVCSLERDVLPALAAAGRLRASVLEGYFVDIGIPADLERARRELPTRLHRPALLLDRDGVLNVDLGWVGSRDRFVWMEGALAAVREATSAGWHVLVASNQSGVARGFYDEAAVEDLFRFMAETCRANGGTLDDWRFCPFHPQAPRAAYRRDSDCRKPAPGMLRDLLATWEVPPARAVMIGDTESDMTAAAAAGVHGVRFPCGPSGTGDPPDLARTVARLLTSPSPLRP